MSDEADAGKDKDTDWFPRIAAAAIVIGVVGWAVFAGGGDDGSNEADKTRDAERVCAEEFIPARLKSPSSAESELHASGGPVTYTVTGTVDAENSFGAMLRSDVTCIVRLGDDEWTLISVSGID